MRAVVIEQYGVPPVVQEVPRPEPADGGVVLKVEATGLCRSDWHGWMGHDPDIVLPACPRARTRRDDRGGRRRGLRVAGRRSGHHAVHLRVRVVRTMPRGQPAGLPASGAARLHLLGLLRRVRRCALRVGESGAAPGRPRLRHRGRPRLPVRDLLPRHPPGRPRRRGERRRDLRLRRRRPVGGDDRGRARRTRHRRRHQPRRSEAGPRVRRRRHPAGVAGHRRTRSATSPAAAPT